MKCILNILILIAHTLGDMMIKALNYPREENFSFSTIKKKIKLIPTYTHKHIILHFDGTHFKQLFAQLFKIIVASKPPFCYFDYDESVGVVVVTKSKLSVYDLQLSYKFMCG